MNSGPVLSIVVPAHDEQYSLPALHERIVSVLEERDVEWELVLVDDASTDETWDVVKTLHARDPRVRGIRLSRNVGEHTAVWVGLKLSRGNPVVVMDADLQHPPDAIPSMLDAWRGGDTVVLMCRRGGPRAGLARRLGAAVYHRTLEWVSENPIPPGHGGFALYDRRVIDGFRSAPTTPPFFRGSALTVAAPTAVLHYEEAPRIHGDSRHSLPSLVQTWLLAFASTSPGRARRVARSTRGLARLCALVTVASLATGVTRRRNFRRSLLTAGTAAAVGSGCAVTHAAITDISEPFTLSERSLVAETIGLDPGDHGGESAPRRPVIRSGCTEGEPPSPSGRLPAHGSPPQHPAR